MRYPFRNATPIATRLQDAVQLRLNSQIASRTKEAREKEKVGGWGRRLEITCDEGDADERDAVEKMKEKAAVGCGEDEVHVFEKLQSIV